MEKTATPSSGFIDIFFLHLFSDWVVSMQKFISRSQSFLQSKLDCYGNSKVSNAKNIADFKLSSRQFSLDQTLVDDGSLCRADVEMVMGKLGIFCSQEGEKLQERLGVDELSRLFEEKEPSLEEVKEAFYVFDENRDGFIDAKELQRVLCALGLMEGSELENCIKMIRSFDENGDGRIDFNEFVKFMENSLC